MGCCKCSLTLCNCSMSTDYDSIVPALHGALSRRDDNKPVHMQMCGTDCEKGSLNRGQGSVQLRRGLGKALSEKIARRSG